MSALELFYNQVDLDSSFEYLNESITLSHYVKNLSKWKSQTYQIIGILDDKNNDIPFQIMFTGNEFDTIKDDASSGHFMQILAFLGNNQSENIRFFKDINQEDGLVINHVTKYSSMLYQLQDLIKYYLNIIYGVGLFFVILASILIFTFISTSIVDKQKEIGTLRAIGASGKDISKIFIAEGLIIALITSVLANTGIGVIVVLLNQAINQAYDTPLTLLYISIINVGLVIFLALFIVFLSTFLPIRKIIRMKPIHAIKNLK